MTCLFTPIDEPTLKQIAAYWSGLRDGCALPSRQQIDPTGIPAAGRPHLFLVDFSDEEPDMVFRLGGPVFERQMGTCLKGKSLRDLPISACDPSFLAEYRDVRRYRAPSYVIDRFADPEWTHVSVKRILLPLSTDGTVVDGALGAAIFFRSEACPNRSFLFRLQTPGA